MIGGDSVLAVITARGGSKGVPGKNIRPAGGRPLIEWTIAAARESRYIDRLILSSDDPAIIEVAQQAGCEAPFRRAPVLASDEASSADVLVDALEKVPGHGIAILLQPTSPLRCAEDIDGALELMWAHGAPSCVTVRPADDHPYWTFQLDDNERLAPYCQPAEDPPARRQDLPAAWCLNGAVYIVRTDWFLHTRRLISPETVAYRMPAARSVDIDTLDDFERLELALRDMQTTPTR